MLVIVEEGELLSHAILRGVAEVEEAPPEDLPPLAETIDPEVLDELDDPAPPVETFTGDMSFDYSGCHIIVDYGTETAVSVMPRSEVVGGA